MSEEAMITYKPTQTQSSLLFAEKCNPNHRQSHELNILKFYFLVKNDCNFDALDRAFNAVLKTNDSLRLRFCRKWMRSRQYMTDYTPYQPEHVHLNDRSEFDAYLESTRFKPLPTYNSPLYWASVVEMGDCGALVMRINHLCMDGYSISLIFSQLEKYYCAFSEGKPEPVIRTGSILDYFKQDEEYCNSEDRKADRAYWMKIHKHQPAYHAPASFAISAKGDVFRYRLDGERYAQLSQYCSEHMFSMAYMTNLLTALTTYVISGSRNFCLMTLSHGRRNFKMKQTVGSMLTYVPMYYYFEDGKTLNEIAAEHFQRYLEALTHGRLPLVEHNPMTFGEAFRNKLNFSHFCWLLHSPMDFHNAVTDPQFETGVLGDDTLSYQFYCAVYDTPGSNVSIELSYMKKRYSPEMLQKIADVFDAIVDRMVNSSDVPVESLKKLK